MASPDGRNPLRTGIFGIVLVACLVLVSFGYTSLPFWPQGKPYEAYFTDAGGISPGNDVNVSGINVGKVTDVALAGDAAKVTFTVDRDVKVGDQSLVAIKTDTVLGEKSLAVTPRGGGKSTVIPLGRTTTPYTLNTALQDLGQNAGELDKPQFEQALQTLTDSLRDATPQLRGALDGVAALSRSINKRDEALEQLLAHAKKVSDTLAQRAGQVNQLIIDGNQLFAALDERRQALSNLIAGIDDVSQQLSGFVADNRREFKPALEKLNLVHGQPARAPRAHRRGAQAAAALRDRARRGRRLGPRLPDQPVRPAARRRSQKCCWTPTSSRASCPTASPTCCSGFISERLHHQAEVAMTHVESVLRTAAAGCGSRWPPLLVAMLLAGVYLVWPSRTGHKVVGYFTSAVGLYPGDDVRVVGVPVGTDRLDRAAGHRRQGHHDGEGRRQGACRRARRSSSRRTWCPPGSFSSRPPTPAAR